MSSVRPQVSALPAMRRRAMLPAVLLALALAACGSASSEARVPLAWYELQLEMIRETPGFSPPVAARALAYSGVALWEAVAPSLKGGRSLAGQLAGLEGLPAPESGYDAAAAANHALAGVIRGLYPNALAAHLAAVDELERELAATLADTVDGAALERSRRFGAALAAAILEWSSSDGGAEGYQGGFFGYTPASGPGAWVPTPRRSGPPFPPLHPAWGENRPLVLEGGECMAPPPPPYSEEPGSLFHAQALEVYETVLDLSAEERAVALHWADDPGQTSTPAGHWVAILSTVLAEGEASLAVAAQAYARLGIAANDAFISCWATKYRYNLVRPITYIQRVIDPGWNASAITDPVTTPPFPEYTSGHSVLSMAVATVLERQLGAVPFVDRSHLRRGYEAREYPSFTAAAAEAAISRLYGGIHFRAAIEAGLEQGRCVAARIDSLRFTDD